MFLDSWICFFGNLKQVPLEHFAKSDCLRCDLLRFHTFIPRVLDDGHWKTNRIIRRPRPLLQSIFANFGDVEDVWAALLSSWAYEGNCPQSIDLWSLRLLPVDSSHARFFSVSRLTGSRENKIDLSRRSISETVREFAWDLQSLGFAHT